MEMIFKNSCILSSMLLMLTFQSGQCFYFDSGDEQSCPVTDGGLQTCDFDERLSGASCPGFPLILTPYLDTGRVQEAQEASRVERICDITSYSGFFTVDTRHDSNMFFWFFPSADGNASAPLVVWLNGGPGITSLFGLFIENGPFSVSKDLRLVTRKYAWTTSHSVLYIDPVGTGFSFTDAGGYNTNVSQTGCNLYNAFGQFFTLFPQYRNNEFYLTGQSYASKYIAAVSYLIHTKNPTAQLKINLKGFAVGNTFLTDPVSMMHYGDYLYQVGLVDEDGKGIFKSFERKIIKSIESKQWILAFELFNILILGDRLNSTIFKNLTGFSSFYNILTTKDSTAEESHYVEEFLSKPYVLRALHVGKRKAKFEVFSVEPRINLIGDDMKSVKPWIEMLLEHYRVMFYSGQLDIIEAPPLAESFLNTLRWSGSTVYQNAQRKKWYVRRELAGYSKVAENLTFLLVRNAGHRVPTDQPAWALDLISRFTRNQRF